ncbi:MAG: hypothetical protein R2912_07915 [Eubacteriales bacterium]
MKVALTTLGCKVNHYETEAMRELFSRTAGEIAEFSDLCGCVCDQHLQRVDTQTSDTKSRQMIARAHRMNPSALVVAVGCYAQTAPEAVASLMGCGSRGRHQRTKRLSSASTTR